MRLWVKRGFNGTPASILLDDQDLIDDVKDAVFRKYPVALARAYDSPDVNICIVAPSSSKPNTVDTKVLAVDDCIGSLIRANYPSGQRIEDALVIQVPTSQGRRSPYIGPVRNSNSPLSGTLSLMTHDMQDFEYFPETPPVGDGPGSQEYINSGRSFVPSNYSSGASQSSAGLQAQQSQAAIEGSFRPAPTLSMNGQRYVRERAARPGMLPRATTNASSNTSGSYGRNDGAVTFYPKQGRTQRSSSNARSFSHSPRQGSIGRADELTSVTIAPAIPAMSLGDERSMSPSVVPLSDRELSASSLSRHASGTLNTMSPMPEAIEIPDNSTGSSSARGRRESIVQSPRPTNSQRPALARTLTASKLNLVTKPESAHSSTHSIPTIETKPKPVQGSTFGIGGLLEGVVPPIVVLIVEDNMINQRILETFMKRCKIRCLTAKNGREAVDKWKKGGVHLVLMDIQMPVMSGIEAAKEIRRLERANGIGVFSKKEIPNVPADDVDILTDLHFKSPVIIVALTASSLQSDRHEALAAGCNDFLTKPVSLVWLEKKVLEWGYMQALIDFEGWKKFRGLKESVTPKS